MFYAKIADIIFEVDGTRTIPKTWKLSCEHTGFKGVCISCAKKLAEAIDPQRTGAKYIKEWANVQFLN